MKVGDQSPPAPTYVHVRLRGSRVVGVFAEPEDADECPGDRTISVPLRSGPVEMRDWHTYTWWMSEPAPVYCGATRRPYGPENAGDEPTVVWTTTPTGDEFLVVAGFASEYTIHPYRRALEERRKWKQRNP